MKTGECITVCAGSTDYECRIKSFTEDAVFLEILSSHVCGSEPDIKVTLYQAVPKLDKLEHIVQKSVELGVTEIVPVLTRRCISRPAEKDFKKKLDRLNKIALEAAKQSGRGIIPKVSMLTSFNGAVERMKNDDCPLMLYEEGGIRFSEVDTAEKKSYSILVGSEGGFDPEEALLAENSGVQSVWLGNRILRCETAPVTALSILMYITKNM
jgi:16S rRNA (uracil1498-N3)-methyltransferase